MAEFRKNGRSVLLLAFWSCFAGALTGLVVAGFRLALEDADKWRNVLVFQTRDWPAALGLLLTVGTVAAAAASAALLVRRFSPDAAGSGIPHVEAVVRGDLPAAPLSLIPVKFVGGLLAMGGGLVLGREGPSVQMGAGLGNFVGRVLRLPESDCMALLAACGGAGIATAFNAPIAGAVFVLEELVRRFDLRTTIAALGSSCCAIAIARVWLGDIPDFQVKALGYAESGSGFLFLCLGLLTALLGMGYSRALVWSIRLADRLEWPVEFRAALIGGLVGIVAWFAPTLVGGGEAIAQRTLSGQANLPLLPAELALRFFLGPVSYASGTPGGLFAPMLALGAQCGLLFATLCHLLFPHVAISGTSCAVVAMAAFFTAVVRVPVTGIVLVTELTGSFTQLMPMLWACFAATVIPTLFGVPPIYDSLSQPVVQRERGGATAEILKGSNKS
jgi:chloride channel protein, CIC family